MKALGILAPFPSFYPVDSTSLSYIKIVPFIYFKKGDIIKKRDPYDRLSERFSQGVNHLAVKNHQMNWVEYLLETFLKRLTKRKQRQFDRVQAATKRKWRLQCKKVT